MIYKNITTEAATVGTVPEENQKMNPYDLQKIIDNLMGTNPEFAKDIEANKGEVYDGYHSFNELYHHRALLFATICNLFPTLAWKSKQHHDGSMYDGMFICGIDTAKGQATYHYDVEPYWNMFHVKELEKAPEFDGHTPDVALQRIYSLSIKGEK